GRVAADKHVHVIGHRLNLMKLTTRVLDHAAHNRLEPFANLRRKHRPAVLRAPHDVVRADVDDVPVGACLVAHTNIISQARCRMFWDGLTPWLKPGACGLFKVTAGAGLPSPELAAIV